MLVGDFNTPLLPLVKLGCFDDFTESMADLENFFYVSGIFYLDLKGVSFTWSNHRQGKSLIWVKLDKFSLSSKWSNVDDSVLEAKPRIGVDHNSKLMECKV